MDTSIGRSCHQGISFPPSRYSLPSHIHRTSLPLPLASVSLPSFVLKLTSPSTNQEPSQDVPLAKTLVFLITRFVISDPLDNVSLFCCNVCNMRSKSIISLNSKHFFYPPSPIKSSGISLPSCQVLLLRCW